MPTPVRMKFSNFLSKQLKEKRPTHEIEPSVTVKSLNELCEKIASQR